MHSEKVFKQESNVIRSLFPCTKSGGEGQWVCRERGQFKSGGTNGKAAAVVQENDDKMQNSSVAIGLRQRMQRILRSRIKKTWKTD